MIGPTGAAVRVSLIGELRVERGDATYRRTELGSRMGRKVLALLAVDPGRTLSSAALVDELWPTGRPDSGDATIASLVSRLRRTLGAGVITGGRAGYRLGAAPDVDVDLEAAARLVTEAEHRLTAQQPGLAVVAAHAGMALLEPGVVLADEVDADWVAAARIEQAALLRRARHVVAVAARATGDHRSAERAAEAAVAADPLDEQAVRGLVASLADGGEVAAALATYERFRQELAEQLGADPAPVTRRLHESILRGEASQPVARERAHQPRPTDGLAGERNPARARPARPGLAGRDDELGTLQRAWAEAASGTGSLILLAGEPGAGKTRLAEELAEVVQATGGTVLSARCYDAEKGLFLQPFVDAISLAVAAWPPAAIRAAATEHLGSLAGLVPEIRTLTGATPIRHGQPDVERRRSIEAVSALICGLAADQPLLLVLDDLHNAGRSTIELLHYLRTRLRTSRLLVAATVRSAEGAATLNTLASVGRRIEVGGLPPAAVQALADAAGQARLAGEISRRTGGHALFVVEILRGLAEGIELPESLQAAVLARVDGLGQVAQSVLRSGAVIGASFDPRSAAALSGTPTPEALRCCEQAAGAGLLVASGRNYEFANDVLREVVYATTPEPTRLAHHLRAVDLLADRPEQVAVHAMAIEDWPRAARAWLVAAQHALDGFAAADAVSLAGNAIDAAERSASDELSARSFLIRGRAYYASGEYPKSWRDLADAVAAARAAGDARLEMVALREQSHDLHVALGYPPADSEGPMRECLRIAESLGDRAREADVLNRLAVLAISRLDFVNALDLGERALRIGRTTGKTRAVIYGLDAVKTANAYLGETPRLSEIIAELEPLLRADGDLLLLQWTVFESFVMPLARGDRDGARARLEAGLALNRRSGLTAMEPFFVAHLGWLHRLFGELETAAEVGARAVAIGREHPHAWWQATAATTYASTLTALGRNAEAAREVERVLPLVDAAGIEAYRLRCLAALAASTDSTDVLREADELLHSVRAPDGCAWLLGADAYLGVASAWVARGDVGRARDALAPMRTAARRLPWPTLVRMADAVVPG